MRRFVKFIDIRFFFFLGIVIFLSMLLGNSLLKLFERKQEVSQSIQSIEDKVAKLRSEIESMNKVLQQAATPSFIEKEARRRLNMKKPGEKMVIIVPPKNDVNQEAGIMNHESKEEEKLSLWGRFKKILFP